jgi:hypothetical protein
MNTNDERADQTIVIDGDTFVAELLIPNFEGKYDCICENCVFDIYWAKFGRNQHCDKVKCIHNDFNDGNRNVWSRVGGLDDVEPYDPPTWWVEYTYKYEYWDWDENEWLEVEDCKAERIKCQEKELEKRVERLIQEELRDERYQKMDFTIEEYYITTDYEM